MEHEVMLTTFDNPFDPFDEFAQWFLFDVSKGYNTCSLLARIARSSDGFSTIEDKRETERAIDAIIANDFLNIYEKVVRTSTDNDEDVDDEVDATNEEDVNGGDDPVNEVNVDETETETQE